MDYYGGKVVMGWGVALWSLATFLTPWAAETSLWALLAMRALLGVAEGVALPCMNNMVARYRWSTKLRFCDVNNIMMMISWSEAPDTRCQIKKIKKTI